MRDILRRLQRGRLTLAQAERLLRADQVRRVGTRLKLDLHRAQRTGIPEVVVAEGKRPQDVLDACAGFLQEQGRVLVTRCWKPLPFGRLGVRVERHAASGVVLLRRRGVRPPRTGGRVAILTGGASDARVAEEAQLVAQEMGCRVFVEHDVGVAGLFRVLAALERMARKAPHVYIVAAGREGALAPVVAGLVPGPVIGVPVATGYGHRGRGEAALATMLQSCSPLVTVNIDAGFVAGAVGAQIANRLAAAESGRRGAPAPWTLRARPRATKAKTWGQPNEPSEFA